MFTEALVIKQLPAYRWQLFLGFSFISKTGLEVKIPKGFITDLASVPRPLWWFISPAGKHSQACVIHDYMYDNALFTKETADKLFFEALQELGVPSVRAWVMYFAVKFFGRGAYVK